MKSSFFAVAFAAALIVAAGTDAADIQDKGIGDLHGLPLAGIKVTISATADWTHQDQRTVSKADTDADGRVTFRDLAPGKYVLVIGGKDSPVSGLPAGAAIRAEIKFEGTTNADSLPGNFAVETCACHTDQPTRIGLTAPQGGPVTVVLGIKIIQPKDLQFATPK